MACCILIAAMIGAILAIKSRLLSGKDMDKTMAALTWRLRAED